MLTTTLSNLETLELVRRIQETDLAYLFKHALVRDTAYESLLKNERKRLHRVIGDTLEREYPHARIENAALLVKHYVEAAYDPKILEYGACAGDYDADHSAMSEAIEHYSAALAAARRMDAPRDTIIALVGKLGRQYESSSAYEHALDTYIALGAESKTKNDPAYELASLMLQATLRATPTSVHDPVLGQQLLDRALVLAQELNDPAAQAKIFWNLLLLNGFQGKPAQAIGYGELSLALAREFNLTEQIAYTLNDLGPYGYFSNGEPDKARASLAEARGIWRELRIMPMLSDNLNNSGLSEYLAGNYDRARAFSDEALTVSEETVNAWGIGLAHTYLGCVAYERGDYGMALAQLEPAYTIAHKTGTGIQLLAGVNLALLYASLGELEAGWDAVQVAAGEVGLVLYRAPSKGAYAYLTFLRGDVARADALLAEARPRSPDELEFSYLPNILAEGEIGLALARPEHVVTYTTHTAEGLRQRSMRSFVADAELYRGRALRMMGDWEAARAAFRQGVADAQEIGSVRALWQLHAQWSNLERACDNLSAAEELQAHAQALVNRIAATLPESLREKFLHTAAVSS